MHGGQAGAGLTSLCGTETPDKPITVTVEEKRVQRVQPGADVTFVCTAKSKVRGRGRSMAGVLQGTSGCVQGHSGYGDTPRCPPGPTEQRDTQGCTHGNIQGSGTGVLICVVELGSGERIQ